MTGFSVYLLLLSVFLHPARVTAKIPTSRTPAITLFPFIYLPFLLFFSIFIISVPCYLSHFSDLHFGTPPDCMLLIVFSSTFISTGFET